MIEFLFVKKSFIVTISLLFSSCILPRLNDKSVPFDEKLRRYPLIINFKVSIPPLSTIRSFPP